LSETSKDEIANTYPMMKLFIESKFFLQPNKSISLTSEPDSKLLTAYIKLSPDRQVVYKQYFTSTPSSEEETIRKFAKMHTADPDIYAILELIASNIVEDYQGSKEGQKFLKYVSHNLLQ
jgi:hypothetical protein